MHPDQGISAMSHATGQFPALILSGSSGVGQASRMHMAVVLSSCTHHSIQEDRFLLCSKIAALG